MTYLQNNPLQQEPVLQKAVLSEADLQLLTGASIPQHIAIIPDGNRRFAKSSNQPADFGYIQGTENTIEIVRTALQLGIKTVTVYSFSTENWKRPQEQIDQFMHIIEHYLNKYTEEMRAHGIRLQTIGVLKGLPTSLQEVIKKAVQRTNECSKLTLILALNYGGRDEITRAVKKIAKDIESGILTPDQITEELISNNLDTSSIPDPDLIIRTSGEQRVSNFLLWQGSYAEVLFQDLQWPEFTPKMFLQAILEYQRRSRRKGA